MLVQVTVNIALYYLVHWLPQNLALDGRQELYDQRDRMAYPREQRRFNAESTDVHRRGRGTDTSNPIRYGGMSPANTIIKQRLNAA